MRPKAIATFLLCAALYQGAAAAGKRLTSDAEMRHTWVDSMNVNVETGQRTDESGEAYFAAGVGNRDFVFAVSPPDQTTCDSLMGFLAQDQPFLEELATRGFRNIGCVRWENGKSTWTTRAITRKPAAPSPAPHTVPRRHDVRASVAIA